MRIVQHTGAITACLAAQLTAQGASVHYEDQERRTNVYLEFASPNDTQIIEVRDTALGTFYSDSTRDFTDPGGSFASAVAFKTSHIDDDTVSATHRSTSMTFGESYGLGMSLLFVEFSVDDRLQAHVDGSWNFSRSTVAAAVFIQTEVARVSNTGDILEIVYGFTINEPVGVTGSQVIDQSLDLAPGRYQLLTATIASSRAGVQSEASLDYTLTFIPAPGTLAAASLLGLAATRRRR